MEVLQQVQQLRDRIKELESENKQLKADLLEMAEAYYYGEFNPPLRLKALQITNNPLQQ